MASTWVAPEQATADIIEQIRRESFVLQVPMSSIELRFLGAEMAVLFTDPGASLMLHVVNNKAVSLIRSAILGAKHQGLPQVRVRFGLRIPVWWQDRYESIYLTEYPVVLSGVLQNAFLGNPGWGERSAWNGR